jgi:hypothetical protein
MRQMRVRFTVRRIMAAVAIVAVLVFAIVQFDRYRKLAIFYNQKVTELRLEEDYTKRNIQRTEVVITSIRARLKVVDSESAPRLRSLLDDQRDQMASYAE